MQINQALEKARQRLAPVSDTPELDGQWLALQVLNQKESAWLITHDEQLLSAKQEKDFGELIERRATGMPLAYVLGEWEFYGRRFVVDERVLVPRPSTEDLVDEALKYIDRRPMTIADVGTGSGCVVITLALEVTGAGGEVKFIATDLSPTALEVARINAERHGVLDKIEFIQGDMLEPLRDRKIDLIVSNPPYVPTGEILPHEPVMALDGGPDGQEFVRVLESSTVPVIFETTGGRIELSRLNKAG